MIFRSISFIPGYSPVPSAYEPVGVLCDESLFIAQGWRACFTAAGVNVCNESISRLSPLPKSVTDCIFATRIMGPQRKRASHLQPG
jgi:hypothetical protein